MAEPTVVDHRVCVYLAAWQSEDYSMITYGLGFGKVDNKFCHFQMVFQKVDKTQQWSLDTVAINGKLWELLHLLCCKDIFIESFSFL